MIRSQGMGTKVTYRNTSGVPGQNRKFYLWFYAIFFPFLWFFMLLSRMKLLIWKKSGKNYVYENGTKSREDGTRSRGRIAAEPKQLGGLGRCKLPPTNVSPRLSTSLNVSQRLSTSLNVYERLWTFLNVSQRLSTSMNVNKHLCMIKNASAKKKLVMPWLCTDTTAILTALPNSEKSGIWKPRSKNPEIRINPEKFHPCIIDKFYTNFMPILDACYNIKNRKWKNLGIHAPYPLSTMVGEKFEIYLSQNDFMPPGTIPAN